jgi:acyl-CoA thioesterase FadM
LQIVKLAPEGTLVKEGDFLVQFDPTEQETNLRDAEAALHGLGSGEALGCELGEEGLISGLGFPTMYFYDKYGIFFPRRAASFEYVSPVSPRDVINLRTEIKKVGTTALTLLHTFYKENKNLEKPVLTARAEVVIVAFDEKNHRKAPLPSWLMGC